jgi:hypothetical protein
MFSAPLLCKILRLHTALYPKLTTISYYSSDKSITCLSSQKPWFNARAVYVISMSIGVPHLPSQTGTIIGAFEATVPRDAVSFCSYNLEKDTMLTTTNTGVQLTQQLVLLTSIVYVCYSAVNNAALAFVNNKRSVQCVLPVKCCNSHCTVTDRTANLTCTECNDRISAK